MANGQLFLPRRMSHGAEGPSQVRKIRTFEAAAPGASMHTCDTFFELDQQCLWRSMHADSAGMMCHGPLDGKLRTHALQDGRPAWPVTNDPLWNLFDSIWTC